MGHTSKKKKEKSCTYADENTEEKTRLKIARDQIKLS
jgi:hypothetical protein